MGIYATEETGQCIRKYRLDQNMSQESLCKGICAISYLSKIETRQVCPNDEIVVQLFRALGIEYRIDEVFMMKGKKLLEDFFKAYFFEHFTQCEQIFKQLDQDKAQYLHSPLMLDFMIAKIYFSQNVSCDKYDTLIKELAAYEKSFSATQLYRFLYIKSKMLIRILKDYKDAFKTISRLHMLEKTASSISLLAEYYYCTGDYLLSTQANEEAFNLAVYDGNILLALNICFLQAAAYSNMKNTFLMLKYYNRALNLNEGIGNDDYKGWIYYNLGATYLTLKAYKQALAYCLQSLALCQSYDKHSIALYHKLALIYLEAKDTEQAQYYLNLAYMHLEQDAEINVAIMKKALDIIQICLQDENYLHNPDYLSLLEAIYVSIDEADHFGYKQFHGDYLIACYKANRRYKEALKVTEELYVQNNYFPKEEI